MRNFKKATALILALSVSSGFAVPALAENEPEYATREYVISEFVQSVGRNKLTSSDYILSTFTDNEDISDEYRSDVSKAATNGIVQGYDDKTLKPQEHITRIEALAMFARCIPELEETSEAIDFTDVPEWAKEDMTRLTRAGLVYGYGDGTLGAEDYITEEQVKLLTDRSDEALKTVTPGESFYGYINNKIFRNYEGSRTVIDPIHGAVVSLENSWSHFEDIAAGISDKETEILTKLVNGSLTYEKNTPEQRVYDLYDCIKHADEDDEIDKDVYIGYRQKILDADTPEEFIQVVKDIYKETGTPLLLTATAGEDPETNAVYPVVCTNFQSDYPMILFDKTTKDKYEKDYISAYTSYIKTLGDFSDSEINVALSLQNELQDDYDFLGLYKFYKAFRLGSDPSYTEENFAAEIEAIEAQHPDLYSDENISEEEEDTGIRSLAETSSINKDMDVPSFLTDVGFSNFDKVIISEDEADIIRKINIDKSNLNAYKINALVTLCTALGITVTDEEEAAEDNLKSVVVTAMTGWDDAASLISGTDADESGDEEEYDEGFEDDSYDMEIMFEVGMLLPDDIGMIYCDCFYDDETSEVIGDMIDDIWEAYLNRFEANEWLDEETKLNAEKKIVNMYAIIGYPDNYEYPEIVSREDGGTYFKNMLNIMKDNLNTNIRMCADQEFSRTMLFMTPDEVNACYIPTLNIMNVPAGILNKPIYDPGASYAANLGAIGAIIGHEIGHAFDAEGSQYDENGCIKNWWTDETAAKFDEIKQYFIEYYSQFEVIDDVVQDSETTITENMADYAGMTVIMDIVGDDKEAQKEALESYAAMWATIGDASLLTSDSYMQDVHSANQVRVNAVVASLDCFYEIYDISPDDPMYVAPEKRLKLW